MQDLKQRIVKANTLLASYAVPHEGILGREKGDTDDCTRFPFQRDRDRIIHTTAFRRLKHKTQVFVTPTSDHFRTRLTHTLEVAQISRDMARTLGLNEDLAEAIALAHDLGHTPFGHAGEEALHGCMQTYQKHFEHNEQSLRIVTLLEERKPDVFGLNLNREVLEGLMKHSSPHDHPSGVMPMLTHSPTLEAHVVNLADEIAYTAHDCEDGLRAGFFTASDLAPLELIKRIAGGTSTLRSMLIDLLVSNVYGHTDALLTSHSIATLQDVLQASAPLVAFSEGIKKEVEELRAFLWKKLYMTDAVQADAKRGQESIARLFHAYMRNPPHEVEVLRERTKGSLDDAVKDFIAGMTDSYAVEKAAKLS